MSGGFNLDDYVDVAERIALFYEKYPDGAVRTVSVTFMETPPGWYAVAEVFADADGGDPKGVGTAFEPVPGKTQFTRDSECQNAETAAWGRAIIAAGIGAKRGAKIASQQEVQARQEAAGGELGPASPAPPAAKTVKKTTTTQDLVAAAAKKAQGRAKPKDEDPIISYEQRQELADRAKAAGVPIKDMVKMIKDEGAGSSEELRQSGYERISSQLTWYEGQKELDALSVPS